VLGAETEGMIGYMIEQELGNLLAFEVPFATLLTQVEVDAKDPAFQHPTKPIGPVYAKEEAEALAKEKGWASPPTATSSAAWCQPQAEAHFRNPPDQVAAGERQHRDLRRRWRHPDHVRRAASSRASRR
jgi:hypothetical protein